MALFSRTWSFNGIAANATSLADMVAETESSLTVLKEMLTAGVWLDPETSEPSTDCFYLATRDEEVAKRFDMEPDDEVDG